MLRQGRHLYLARSRLKSDASAYLRRRVLVTSSPAVPDEADGLELTAFEMALRAMVKDPYVRARRKYFLGRWLGRSTMTSYAPIFDDCLEVLRDLDLLVTKADIEGDGRASPNRVNGNSYEAYNVNYDLDTSIERYLPNKIPPVHAEMEQRSQFGFTFDEIAQLAPLLGFPDMVRPERPEEKWRAVPGPYCLAVLLRRLKCGSNGKTAETMAQKKTSTSAWTNRALRIIRPYFDLLRVQDNPYRVSALDQRIPDFIDKINAKTGRVDDIFAFIDGTRIPICRPSDYHEQMAVYNGWKASHNYQVQAVVTPDGMFMDLASPVAGRHNDRYAYNKSSIAGMRMIRDDAGHYHAHFDRGFDTLADANIYGDSGYTLRPGLITPHSTPMAAALRSCAATNLALSRARVAVEWAFGIVNQTFDLPSLKSANKRSVDVYGLFSACILFTNLKNIANPNQISQYFGCRPWARTWQEYLARP